jgi:N-acetylglucosaminyl-diphospho-decaprenol L-rhamnosyltransferase
MNGTFLPVVDIIIVNWNSGAQLKKCLEQIEARRRHGFTVGRVVVVDNASTDSSVLDLGLRSEQLVIHQNSRNTGFAAACNRGAEESRSDFLLFANPDVYLGENCLSRLVGFLSDPTNDNFAICAPRLVDEEGTTLKTCSRFPTTKDFVFQAAGLNRVMPKLFSVPLMTEWSHDKDRIIEQPMGACLLVRADIFRQLKGFDERFFVYFEEVDFCLRCKRLGYDAYFLRDATAEHTGCGCSDQVPGKRLFYLLKSRILYGAKHFSPASILVLCLATFLLEPLSRIALATVHRSKQEFVSVWEGYRLLWRAIPSIVQSRKGHEVSIGAFAQGNSGS